MGWPHLLPQLRGRKALCPQRGLPPEGAGRGVILRRVDGGDANSAPCCLKPEVEPGQPSGYGVEL